MSPCHLPRHSQPPKETYRVNSSSDNKDEEGPDMVAGHASSVMAPPAPFLRKALLPLLPARRGSSHDKPDQKKRKDA